MGNVTSSVAAKFAFFPPDPPTYEVYKEGDGGRLLMSGLTADKNVDVHLLDTKGGNKIVATFWKHPAGRFTILYSHGNAADLGQMQELFIELRAHLRVNIMSYDYSGYGASTGKPSELNTYYDIEAVYNCLKSELRDQARGCNSVWPICWERSHVYLAAQFPRLRAIVLHSAILQAYEFCIMLSSVQQRRSAIVYRFSSPAASFFATPVIESLTANKSYGTSDDIVDLSHGKRLWELAKEKYEPLWVQGGGHCNLETFPEYIKHLRKFVNAMEKLSFSKRGKARPTPATNMSEFKHNKCLRFGKR
ncbi:Alpha/beta hydrolase domain-containing protein 17C [Sesamum angolense]|uniref:Alpha/beta hydrolase domain-containing protein 17C n=1 Tax=Sesamum angolense TaxID=2727404 RepID=A0AAE2BN25_9LAMI|nr:Alpha/beta hydrolase domain-containing protein 17C [Sesamum angolense]